VIKFGYQNDLPPVKNTGIHGANKWVGSRDALVRNGYILKMRILERMENDGGGCLFVS